ncbi:MAG: DUF1573 domain-containing protein [Candidatus Cryptobacteroides sp.]
MALMRAGLLIVFLFLAGSMQAQDKRTIFIPERVLDSLRASQSVETDLAFESLAADLGPVEEEGSVREAVFTAVNRSGKSLAVTRLNTSCGCLAAKADKTVLAPGEKLRITAKYNPERHIGPFEQRIFVYGDSLLAKLRVTGTVIPKGGIPGYQVVMGPLRLTRKSLTFRSSTEERIAVANAGDKALKLEAFAQFLPAWLTFRTEPGIIEASGTGDIVIGINRDKLPSGTGPLKANVIIEGLPGRPSEHSIEVELIR